jgi:hypothetical protein
MVSYTPTIPISSNIDVSPFKEAVALARLHSVTWTAASVESVEFKFKEDGYTEEDPGSEFTGNTLNAANSLRFIEGTDTAPVMYTASLTLTYPLPPMIKIDLDVFHGANVNTMVFVLSLDLVLRD